MSKRILFTGLTAILVVATTPPATAQVQQGGGTGFGSFGSGGSTFGNGTFGNSGSGSNTFGNSTFGNSGFGSSGFGSGAGTSGFGTGGFGNTGFGQSGAGGAQGFVGRDSGDMQAVFNQLGRSSNQFFQQLNRTMGGRGQNRNRQGGGQANAELPFRVQLRVAFDHVRPQPAAVATTVRNRLETALASRIVDLPEVEMDGDTVILRGVAQSESQRLVIEKLVSLEPGVSLVDNQMTVAEALPSESNPAQSEN